MSPKGLDPDYEWLVKHVPFAEPDYDSRLYVMQMVLPDMTALDSFINIHLMGIREYCVPTIHKKSRCRYTCRLKCRKEAYH
jgi:hypothetical protein